MTLQLMDILTEYYFNSSLFPPQAVVFRIISNKIKYANEHL